MSCNKEVEAVIVTYNPNASRLLECVTHVSAQVKRVIIVDNNSKNSHEIVNITTNLCNVETILLEKNIGIATAINIAVKKLGINTQWLLTLDQDSIISNNLIQTYMEYINIDKLAILTPIIIDSRRYNPTIKYTAAITEVNQCIQSGSLFNVKILRMLGGFNDWLFIDYVDYDYCYRIVESGYIIYRVNSVVLNQEFGDIIDSKFKVLFEKLWLLTRWSLFKKLTYVPNISSWRTFYTVRNRIFCMKYLSKRNLIKEVILTPFIYLKILLRGTNRIKILKSIVSGTREGIIAYHNN